MIPVLGTYIDENVKTFPNRNSTSLISGLELIARLITHSIYKQLYTPYSCTL